MINLSDSTGPIEEFVLSSLDDFSKKYGPALFLFAHVHANYGQIHLYLTLNENAEPYDELVGTPIDYIIDFDDWENQSGYQREAEEELTIRLVSGSIVKPSDFDEFNQITGKHVNEVIRSLMARIPSDLVPKRVMVFTETGEFCDEWKPESLPS